MMLVVGQPPTFLLALQVNTSGTGLGARSVDIVAAEPPLSFERSYCCPCSSRRLLTTSNTLGT